MSEETKEVCSTKEDCKCKCKFMHKAFGLKGLSIIYKVLAALLMVYLLYILVMIWFTFFKDGNAAMGDALLLSIQYAVTYAFYALVLLTVSRVLKVLKKIKHAAVNCCNNK